MNINQFYTGPAQDILSTFPNNVIDMIMTSPPYDNIRNYNKALKDKQSTNTFSFPFEEIAKELFRVLKPGGVIVWIVGDAVINGSETGSSFRQALFFMSLGMKLHDTMIYEKNGSSFPARRDGNRYTQIFEYMFILSKGKPKTSNLICDKANKWAGYTNWGKGSFRDKDGVLKERKMKPVPEFSVRNNIWKFNTGKGFSTKDKIAFQHPAIFPEKLAQDHILSWSSKGDIVLDPFSGSGTTAKIAKLLEREYIGIDINAEYNEIAKQRISSTST